MPNFQKDLQRGHVGEAIISRHLGLKRLDGRGADLVCKKSGLLYEIKSDYYNYWKTPNFFIETVSVDTSGKVGGPFQSLEKNIDRFVYYFIKAGVAYEFDTANLVETLNGMKLGPQSSVHNGKYRTLGHKVNREQLIEQVDTCVVHIIEEAI